MIDHDLALLLTGAGIALVSAIIAAIVQHFLSLRTDRIGRERDKEDREDEQPRARSLGESGMDVRLLKRLAEIESKIDMAAGRAKPPEKPE